MIESATATPTSGFAPLTVKFDVTATDEDDDALTYSWDFDGDGDSDSTAEDPTHTYTTAGTYEAEVTVSDGEDERTRTVTVTVFGADDPRGALPRAGVLRTTGFRHDSIPAGIAAIKELGERPRLPGRRHGGPVGLQRRRARALPGRRVPLDHG